MASSYLEILEAIRVQARTEAYAEVKKANHRLLDQAVQLAKDIAPIGGAASRDPHPGQFRDSIYGEDAPDRKGLPASRMRSDDDGAAAIEFGTSRTPEHATFATVANELNVRNPRIDD